MSDEWSSWEGSIHHDEYSLLLKAHQRSSNKNKFALISDHKILFLRKCHHKQSHTSRYIRSRVYFSHVLQWVLLQSSKRSLKKSPKNHLSTTEQIDFALHATSLYCTSFLTAILPKEFHVQNKNDKPRCRCDWPILIHHRLPRQFLSPPFKFLALCHQAVANIWHVLQLFPPIQYLVDVFPHDALDVSQVLI